MPHITLRAPEDTIPNAHSIRIMNDLCAEIYLGLYDTFWSAFAPNMCSIKQDCMRHRCKKFSFFLSRSICVRSLFVRKKASRWRRFTYWIYIRLKRWSRINYYTKVFYSKYSRFINYYILTDFKFCSFYQFSSRYKYGFGLMTAHENISNPTFFILE